MQYAKNTNRGDEKGTVTVTSSKSKSFIVTTNSIQWQASEGMLLKLEAFGDPEAQQIPREHFVNTLQIYYLGATRQSGEMPVRPLSSDDLDYVLHYKLSGKAIVQPGDFEAFWEWFGAGLEKIRHQKHMSTLFLKGLLYGFISKAKAEALLQNRPDGTFLVRFSDRYPGRFAVAYNAQGKVKHYLVKPSDTAGNKKTLVDFLKHIKSTKYILQLTPKVDEQGRQILEIHPKHEAFREFYTEKDDLQTTQGDGYEEFSAN